MSPVHVLERFSDSVTTTSVFSGLISASDNGVDAAAANALTALQTLLTNVSTRSPAGGTVVMPPASYAMQGTLDVPAKVKLWIPEPEATVFTWTGAPTNTACVRLTETGAEVDGMRALVTAGDYRRVFNTRASGTRLRNTYANYTSTDLAGSGGALYYIVAPGGSGAPLDDVRLHNIEGTFTLAAGFQFDGLLATNITNLRITDPYVHDTIAPSNTRQRWAFYVSDNCPGCLVQNVRVSNVASGGIHYNSGDSTGTRDNDYGRILNGAEVHGCAYTGVATDYLWNPTMVGLNVSNCETLMITDANTLGGTYQGEFKKTVDASGVANVSPNDADRPMVILGHKGGEFHGQFEDRGAALMGLALDGDGTEIHANFGSKGPRRNIVTRSGSKNYRIMVPRLQTDDTTGIILCELNGTANRVFFPTVDVPTGGGGIKLAGTRCDAIFGHVTGATTASYGVWASGTNCRDQGNTTTGTFTNAHLDTGTGTITTDPVNLSL